MHLISETTTSQNSSWIFKPTSHFVKLGTFHTSGKYVVSYASLSVHNNLAGRSTSASQKNGANYKLYTLG